MSFDFTGVDVPVDTRHKVLFGPGNLLKLCELSPAWLTK